MPENFQAEQGKITAVEKKAGTLDKDTGKKTHEQLEAELKAKHETFFKQVDDTQKVFQKAENLNDPSAKAEMDKDKTEIKNLLDKAAQSGENILSKTETDPNFTTIRQSAERITTLTGSVEKNMQFFLDMRDGQQNFNEYVKPWMEKADKQYTAKDQPGFDSKDYGENLKTAINNLGEFGAMGYVLPYDGKIPSPEFKAIFDGVKKPMMDAMENLLAKQADYTLTYQYDTKEKRDNMPVAIKQILAIRNANGGDNSKGVFGIGYEALGRYMTAGKKTLENAAAETDPNQKKVYLKNAHTYFMDVNISADKVIAGLNEIDADEVKSLPEEYQALLYCMKGASAGYMAESFALIDKIDKGNEAVDSPGLVDAVEKEYGEGDDSPKKSYENAVKVRDSVMDAKEFDMHSPLLGPATEKGLTKLCAIKGKLAAVDRTSLPREYQARFDALSGTVESNIQELIQVQMLIKNSKLTEDINKKSETNTDGKEYFRVVRKQVNGQNVVVVEQTEEFKKLTPDQQKIYLAQYAAVPAEITLDLTRKMELKEDKDWNEGLAKFENGDWQGAKPLLLAYWNKFLNDPEKAVQTSSTSSLLQAIVKIEFMQAKENFQTMSDVQDNRGDIEDVNRPELGITVMLGWDRMDAAERIINSKDCPLTIGQVWDKLTKMPRGKDLVVDGISFTSPRDQQRLLSEPDPEKRRANILRLARAAMEAGMTPFAKKYFEMYFAGEIANKKKTVTREHAEAAFNAKEDAGEQIKAGIKNAHDQARTHFITERNRRLNLNGRLASDQELKDEAADLDKWESNYQANAVDIEQRVRNGVIDDIWMKNVKKSLNDDYKNAKVVDVNSGELVKDAPVNVWNEAYGGHFGVAENITDSALVFTSDAIRETAAKIAVGILYLEIAAAAGVITGGAASAAILGGAVEVGAGTMFASQAAGFLIEGAVMHTVSVGLNEGAEGFKDGGKFMKGLVTTYATLGIMKGTGAVLGKVGSKGATAVAEGSGEFITPFSKSVAQGSLGVAKRGLQLTGKSVLDSALMTGISWGSEKVLHGKSMTTDELGRAFGENFVTFMVMGGVHMAAEAGKGEGSHAQVADGKEGKLLRDAIRDSLDAEGAAKGAREKADAAKKAGSPDAARLEAEAVKLERTAHTKEASAREAMTADRVARLAEMQKSVDAMKKELENKDLPPEQRKRLEFLVEQFEKAKTTGEDLSKAEKALFEEHRVIEIPDPENPGKTKKVDLFEHYNSKNFAYSKEMVDLMNNYDKLLKEGPKIIKHGGDEFVILHAGPDGKVQMFFGDVGNMGPTNEFALRVKGQDANMVDLYLHEFSQIVRSRFKPGQPVDGPALLNEIKNNLSKKYFGIETKAEFDALAKQWGLDGTWADYQTNMGNARILAGFRGSSRGLQKEFAEMYGDKSSDPAQINKDFAEFIDKKIQGLDSGSPPLTEILRQNLAAMKEKGALADLFPTGSEFNDIARMNPETLGKILSKSAAERTAEENMMVYFALQRVNTAKIETLSGMDAAGTQAVRDRFGKLRQPADMSTLMDFQMSGIDVPRFEGRDFNTADMKFFLDHVLEHGLHEAKKQKDKADIYQSENPFDSHGEIRADHPDAAKMKEAHEKAKADKKADVIAETQKSIYEAEQKLDALLREMRSLREKSSFTEVDEKRLADMIRESDSLIQKINADKYKDAETGADRPGKYNQDISFWMRGRDGKPIEKEHQVYREFVIDMHNTGAINGQKGYATTDAAMRTIADFMMARFPGATAIIRTGGGAFKLVYMDGRQLPQTGGQPMGLVEHQAMIRAALPELNIAVQKVIAADANTVVDGSVRDATESFRKRGGVPSPVGQVDIVSSQDMSASEFGGARDRMKSPVTLYNIVEGRRRPHEVTPAQGPVHLPPVPKAVPKPVPKAA